MGLFEKIFKPRQTASPGTVDAFFKLLSGYTPVFSSRDGGLYEMDLTSSAIHAIATACSKLKPEVTGDAKPYLKAMLQSQPNQLMDTSKFLYRLATVLHVDTTAFIVPSTDTADTIITGLWPVLARSTEVKDLDGEPWLRYTFSNGQHAGIELERAGVLTMRQYRSDLFGDGNGALTPTLDLLDVQRQGMTNAIETSAAIRFLARLAGTIRPEDIVKERKRFTDENLSADNTSGVMMVDAKYQDVQQIENKPYVIDAEQMKLIENNVYNYFGVNQAILQNSYDENGWNAFYEGKIEWFGLQLGLVLTNMLFTPRERAAGSSVLLSSNRLQYASNSTKLSVTRELTDRGIISNYQAAEIWNLPVPPGPERWVIRGEYIDIANLPTHTVDQAKSYLKPPADPVADQPPTP